LGLIGAAVLIGAVNAVVLKLFLWAVDVGTVDLWNDVFHTDEHRWVVVPLALVLGIVLSGVLLVVRQPRLPPPHTNSLAFADDDEPATLGGVGMILFVGLSCLVAGASLGPEAALVGSAAAFGLWCGQRTGDGPTARLLQLSSVGALLVAFVGSFLIVLLPLLMLVQKKQLKVDSAVPVVVAGASSFGTLWLIDHGTKGFGTIPTSSQFSIGAWLRRSSDGRSTS
jgi:H+/Cl- antiporter ClcA